MKFCTSCQLNKDEEGGELRKMRSTSRWLCRLCVEKRSESIYKSKISMTEKDLQRFLRLYYSKKGRMYGN